MLTFKDDEQRITIRSRSGETREEFLKRLTWLVLREQQRRRERKQDREEEGE